MSLTKTTLDLGRISIYDLNTNDIKLSSSDIQLKIYTNYDEQHLKRLKYLFQQITGPNKTTLDIEHFELAARSLCHSLTESNEAHHLAEILFKAYDKNTNDLIDFHEMVQFVWYRERGLIFKVGVNFCFCRTVIDAPREEQIAGLYEAFKESNGKLSKTRLNELLIILKEDFQPKNSSIHKLNQGQIKPLKTDEDIRNRVTECFTYYKTPSDGLNLIQIIDYFLGTNDPLGIQVKTRWNARIARRQKRLI